jgi:parallel beta-helix repeat protein
MQRQYKYYGVILSLLLCGLIIPIVQKVRKTTQDNEFSTFLTPLAAISHSPINISGDVELDNFSIKTGNGTSDDPYVIENLEINADGTKSGIEIRDTSKYLHIRNCTIINSELEESSNGYGWGGITLDNCSNVNIISCTFKDNYIGIYLNNSDQNTLSENFASYNEGFGIGLFNSSKNIVFNNNASFNNEHGIVLTFSSNNTISNNHLSNNGASFMGNGIIIYESELTIIFGNNVLYNNGEGITIIRSHNTIISGNNVSNNGGNGISSSHSNIVIISNNYAINNHKYGINLWNSNNNTVYDNLLFYNKEGGIINIGAENELYNNKIIIVDIVGMITLWMVLELTIIGILSLLLGATHKKLMDKMGNNGTMGVIIGTIISSIIGSIAGIFIEINYSSTGGVTELIRIIIMGGIVGIIIGTFLSVMTVNLYKVRKKERNKEKKFVMQ